MTTAPYEAIHTISELKITAERLNSPFFSKDSMRWFNSRISEGIYRAPNTDKLSGLFVTSERNSYPYGEDYPRLYTVRSFTVTPRTEGGHDISFGTVGEFGGYETLREARKAAVIATEEVTA